MYFGVSHLQSVLPSKTGVIYASSDDGGDDRQLTPNYEL